MKDALELVALLKDAVLVPAAVLLGIEAFILGLIILLSLHQIPVGRQVGKILILVDLLILWRARILGISLDSIVKAV